MREIIEKYKNDPLIKKKLIMMVIGVSLMGFSLSFLREVDLGTDPFTFMNLTLSGRLHMLFGTWQLFLNILMLIIGWFWNKKLLGPGTIYNMVGIGYISDFFKYIWDNNIPREIFTEYPSRALVFIAALVVFAISAAIYMNSDCGLSPYDLLANNTANSIKLLPFFVKRMAFDFCAILIGIIAGSIPNIGTICIAAALGPAISAVGKVMRKMIFKETVE